MELERVAQSLGGRLNPETGKFNFTRPLSRQEYDRVNTAISAYNTALNEYKDDPDVLRSQTAAKDYNATLETAKPALEEYKQAAAEYRAEYEKQQLSQRQYIDSLEAPQDMVAASLRAEAEKAQALADAVRKTQGEVTEKASWGLGFGFRCYGYIVCQTVTVNGETVPLSTYESQAKSLIYEEEARAAKLTRLADFFGSSDPLAEKIGQVQLEGPRAQLVLKNLDDMLEARSQIAVYDPTQGPEQPTDDRARQLAGEKQATIERLTSGGELTQAERSVIYPSTMSARAVDLDLQRQRLMDSNLSHALVVGRVVTSVYDAVRLTGDPTAQQLQQMAFMTETQLSEQQFGAWRSVGVNTALSAAEAYLFFTPGGLALSGAALKAVTPEFVANGIGQGLGLAGKGFAYVAPDAAGVFRGWAASGGIAGDFVDYSVFRGATEFKPAFASELDAFGTRVVSPYVEQEQKYFTQSVARGIAPDVAEATAYRNLYANIAGTDIGGAARGSEILTALEREMTAKSISIPLGEGGTSAVATAERAVVPEQRFLTGPKIAEPSAPNLTRVESPSIVPPAVEPAVLAFTPTAQQMNNLTRELVVARNPVVAAEADVVRGFGNALEVNASAQAEVRAGTYAADAPIVRAARDDLLAATRQLEDTGLLTRLAPLDAEGIVPIDRIYRAETGEVIAQRVAPIAGEEPYQIVGQKLASLAEIPVVRPPSPSPFRSPLQAAADFNSSLRLNSAGGSAFSSAPQRTGAPTLLAERPAFNNPLADLLNPSKLPLAPELTAAEKAIIERYGSTDGAIRNLRVQEVSPSLPLFSSYSRQLADLKAELEAEGLKLNDLNGAIYKGDIVVAVQKPVVFPGESPYAIVAPVIEEGIVAPATATEIAGAVPLNAVKQNAVSVPGEQQNDLPQVVGSTRNPGLQLEIIETTEPALLPDGIRKATDNDVSVYSRADVWDPFLTTREGYMPTLIDIDGSYVPTSKISTNWLPDFRRIIDTSAKYETFVNTYLGRGIMPLQIAEAESTLIETGIEGVDRSYTAVRQVAVTTFDGVSVLINRDIYRAILDKGNALYGVPALEEKIDAVTRGRLRIASSYDFPERSGLIAAEKELFAPILPQQKAVFLNEILKEAEKYPVGYWENSRTFTLYYFTRVRYFGAQGQAFMNGSEMWLDPYAEGVGRSFHHELTHINDAPFETDSEWGSAVYGVAEQWAYKGENWNTYGGYRPAGFSRSYGTKEVVEDPTTLSEEMFSNYAALKDAAKRDPILAIKVERMKNVYEKMSDGEMNDAYWDALSPLTPDLLLRPVNVDPYQVQTAYTVANGVQSGIIALRDGLDTVQRTLFARSTELTESPSLAKILSEPEKIPFDLPTLESVKAEPRISASVPENVAEAPMSLWQSLGSVPNIVRTAVITAALSNPVVGEFLNIITPAAAKPSQITSSVPAPTGNIPASLPNATPASTAQTVTVAPGKDGGIVFSDGRPPLLAITPVDLARVIADARYLDPVTGIGTVFDDTVVSSGVRGGAASNPTLFSSPYLPLGTVVRVCGPGGCTHGVIGDFGPNPKLKEKHIVDLTNAGGKVVGLNGKATVTVSVVGYLGGDTTLKNVTAGLAIAKRMNAGSAFADAVGAVRASGYPKVADITPVSPAVGTSPTKVAAATPPAAVPLPPPAPARVAPPVRPPVTITTPEEPFTLAAYKIPPPTPSKTVVELRDRVSDVASQIEATNQELANVAQQRIPVTQQIAKIQNVAKGEKNLVTARTGLAQLKTLKTPDAKELVVMAAGTFAANQLAGVMRQLGNPALANEINRYVTAANLLKDPKNQTLAKANAAILQGDSLVAKAESFLNSVDTGPKNLAALQKSLQELDTQQASIKRSVAALQTTQKQVESELVLAIKADAEAAAAARIAEATEAIRVGEKIPESVLMTAEESELAMQGVAQAESISPPVARPSLATEYLSLGKTLAQAAENAVADQVASLQETISSAFASAPASAAPVRVVSVTAAPYAPYTPTVVQYTLAANAPSVPLPTLQARFSSVAVRERETAVQSGSGGAQPESPLPEPTVYIVTGGTSAGKTTLAGTVLPKLNPKAEIIDDASLTAADITRTVNDALAAGKVPNFVYVYRDPIEAFNANRSVPIDVFAESYVESQQAVKGLLENQALQKEGLQITLLDNSRGVGNAAPMTQDAFNKIAQPTLPELKQQLLAKTDEMFQAGTIDAEQYAALTGTQAPAKVALAPAEPVVPLVEELPPAVPSAPAPAGTIEAGWLGPQVEGQVAWFKSLPERFTNAVNDNFAKIRERFAIPEPTYQPITPIPTSKGLVPNTVGQGPASPVTSPLAQLTPTQYVNPQGAASPEVGKVMEFYPWKQLSAPSPRPVTVNPDKANPPAVIALGEEPIALLPSPSAMTPLPVNTWTLSPNINGASPPSLITLPAPVPEKIITLAEEPQINTPTYPPPGYADWSAQVAQQDALFGTPAARTAGPTPAENMVPLIPQKQVPAPAPSPAAAPAAEPQQLQLPFEPQQLRLPLDEPIQPVRPPTVPNEPQQLALPLDEGQQLQLPLNRPVQPNAAPVAVAPSVWTWISSWFPGRTTPAATPTPGPATPGTGGGGGTGGAPPPGGTPPTGGQPTNPAGPTAGQTATKPSFCVSGVFKAGVCVFGGLVGIGALGDAAQIFTRSTPANNQPPPAKAPPAGKGNGTGGGSGETPPPDTTTRRTDGPKACGPNDTYASSGCYPPYGTRTTSDIPSSGDYCITSIEPLVVVPGVKPGPNCYNYSGSKNPLSFLGSALGQLLGKMFGTSSPAPTQPTQPVKPPVTPPVATSTPAKPYATLIANPTSVTAGGKSRLIWSSVGTSDCELFAPDNFLMATGTRGSTSTLPLATTTPFVLDCSAPTGATTSAQATVIVK